MSVARITYFILYHVSCADGIKRLTCSGSVRIMQIFVAAAMRPYVTITVATCYLLIFRTPAARGVPASGTSDLS